MTVRLSSLVASVGLALLLAACADAPLRAPVAVALHEVWHAPLPHGGSTAALADWWQAFPDPMLVNLIERAQASNPNLQVAAARHRRARALVKQARAGLLPQVGVSATSSRGKNLNSVPGVSTQSDAQFNASWEIDLFGGKRAEAQVVLQELALLLGVPTASLAVELQAPTLPTAWALPRSVPAFAVHTLPAQRPDVAASHQRWLAALAEGDEAAAALQGKWQTAVAEVEESLERMAATRDRKRETESGALEWQGIALQATLQGGPQRVTSQHNALTAHDDLLTAQADQAQAWLRLYRSLGGGWNADPSATDQLGAQP